MKTHSKKKKNSQKQIFLKENCPEAVIGVYNEHFKKMWESWCLVSLLSNLPDSILAKPGKSNTEKMKIWENERKAKNAIIDTMHSFHKSNVIEKAMNQTYNQQRAYVNNYLTSQNIRKTLKDDIIREIKPKIQRMLDELPFIFIFMFLSF